MSSDRRDRGQIIVIVALASVALILLVGLVIDGGFAWAKRREAQNAADLAALAGTRIVAQSVGGTARTDADVYNAILAIAAANHGAAIPGLGTAAGALYVDDRGIPISGAFVSNTAAVIRSTARGVQVPSSQAWRPFFLGLVGMREWTATATATARTTVGAQAPCAFCVLGATPPFSMQSGQTSLIVNNGAIVSNSGLDLQANPILRSTGTGQAIQVYGATKICNTCAPSPSVTTMPTRILDPLAFLPGTTATGTDFGNQAIKGPNTTTTLNPGRYGTITIEANATASLNPGVYYLNGDVQVASNGTLAGTNVTLVFMGQANFKPQSNSIVHLTAPSPTDKSATFPGVAMYFARGNTGTLQMQSSSETLITGTIYARDAFLDMQSGTTLSTISSMVVVGSTNMQSGSKLTVNYSTSQNVQMPGSAALVR
jgi:hypothetical protein